MKVEFIGGGSMDGKVIEVPDDQVIFFVGNDDGIAEEQYVRFPDECKFRRVSNFHIKE